MKAKNIWAFLIAGFAVSVLAASCDGNKIEEGEAAIYDGSLRNVSFTSAEFTGMAKGRVSECGVCWATDPAPTVNSKKAVGADKAGEYNLSITGLAEATTYYARAYAVSGDKVLYGTVQCFRTFESGKPIVEMVSASDITMNGAKLTASLIVDGGIEIAEMGICYTDSPEPTVENIKVTTDMRDPGGYTVEAIGLEDGKRYYARAYVVAGGETYYSAKDLRFSALENYPVCTRPVLSDPTGTTMKVSAQATQSGTRTILSWGVCWATRPNPSIAKNKVELSTESGGTANTTLTGLPSGTKIYVRTYATTAISTTYSEEEVETTAIISPEVETGELDAGYGIFRYKVNFKGCKIVGLGAENLPVLKAGICFSATKENPTIADGVVEQAKLETGYMDDILVQGLIPGTKFHVRAFATNEAGTGYGNTISFTTLADNLTIPETSGATPAAGMTGLRCYYEGSVTANQSEWQKGRFDALNETLKTELSYRFHYLYLKFTSNTACADFNLPVAGTARYVTISHYYYDKQPTGGTSRESTFDMKITIDKDGLYSFSAKNVPADGGTQYTRFNTIYEKPGVKAYMDEFVAWLQSGKFMIEAEAANSESRYQLIPVDAPDNYYTLARVRGAVTFKHPW